MAVADMRDRTVKGAWLERQGGWNDAWETRLGRWKDAREMGRTGTVKGVSGVGLEAGKGAWEAGTAETVKGAWVWRLGGWKDAWETMLR